MLSRTERHLIVHHHSQHGGSQPSVRLRRISIPPAYEVGEKRAVVRTDISSREFAAIIHEIEQAY